MFWMRPGHQQDCRSVTTNWTECCSSTSVACMEIKTLHWAPGIFHSHWRSCQAALDARQDRDKSETEQKNIWARNLSKAYLQKKSGINPPFCVQIITENMSKAKTTHAQVTVSNFKLTIFICKRSLLGTTAMLTCAALILFHITEIKHY